MNRTMALTMGMIAMLTLIGCGKDNPTGPGSSQKPATNEPSQATPVAVERLLGTWNAKDGRISITFRKSDEVAVTSLANGGTVTVSGTYRINSAGLILQADTAERRKDTSLFTTYTCAIQEEMLILTSPEGKTTAWVRMPPGTAGSF